MQRLRLSKCGSRSTFVRAGIILFVVLAGCGRDSSPKPLLVSAAADLQDAFAEFGGRFKDETGVAVEFNFGASGMLAQQIKAGAKVDVFASANVDFVDQLDRAGLIVSETKRVYAQGRLVVWSPNKPAKEISGLAVLADAAFKRVAIANPTTAPYGMAAKQALEKAGVWSAVEPKIVYGENVRQTMEFARSGNADVAIVSMSLTKDASGSKFVVPMELHPPIDQCAAMVKGSRQEAAARRFLEMLNGPAGREVLGKYGFGVEPPGG